jgi:hypothetical protein
MIEEVKMTDGYRISLHIGDSGFEIESTDKDWVEQKEKEYLSKLNQKQDTNKGDTNPKPEQAALSLPESLTINEFYKKNLKSKIKSRVDLSVFFVYFLEKIAKKDSIKTSDVTDCFGAISYPGYNDLNVTDMLRKAKAKAFLNNVNNSWSTTITGEDFVVNALAAAKE